VSSRGAWLHNAAVAARSVADRGDLWLPGTLGALVFPAWLPLLLTVSSGLRTSDIAFLGAGLFNSELFPLNVVLIATLAAIGMLLGCLVASLADASLLRAIGRGVPDRPLARELEITFSVTLVSVLPAVALSAAVISGAAAVGPAEFGAPDLGMPLVVRVALRLAPLLVALVVAAWLGRVIGAVAKLRAIGSAAPPVGAAVRASVGDLVRHPASRLGLGLVSLLVDGAGIVIGVAVLRLAWAPIEAELVGGHLLSPPALLLLVGFVAIWLALVLALGALHAWVSAWWSLELADEMVEARP